MLTRHRCNSAYANMNCAECLHICMLDYWHYKSAFIPPQHQQAPTYRWAVSYVIYYLHVVYCFKKNIFFPDVVVSVYKAETFIRGCVWICMDSIAQEKQMPTGDVPLEWGRWWALVWMTSLSSLSGCIYHEPLMWNTFCYSVIKAQLDLKELRKPYFDHVIAE